MWKCPGAPPTSWEQEKLSEFLLHLSQRSRRVLEVLSVDPILLFHFQEVVKTLGRELEVGDTLESELLCFRLGQLCEPKFKKGSVQVAGEDFSSFPG